MNENTCVCCGEPIPEGRQVCPKCEKGGDIGIAKMALEEAIENLENPHIHSLTLNNSELTKWLKELKELREENKVLTSECDRLIKEKGELLNKISGGDVLRICQLEEQLEKAKRLLKAAVGTFNDSSCNKDCRQCKWNNGGCEMSCRFAWIHTDEALKLIGGD